MQPLFRQAPEDIICSPKQIKIEIIICKQIHINLQSSLIFRLIFNSINLLPLYFENFDITMSIKHKVDNWSLHSYKINSIFVSILPTFLDQTDKFHMLAICKKWNKMLQNKLFWKGKLVLSNTRLNQIASTDRQRIRNKPCVPFWTCGFTQDGIDEINVYLNSICNWITKMKPLLQLVTELIIDLMVPSTIRNNNLIDALEKLRTVATIQTLEIVSDDHYLKLIENYAPTLNTLILNIRDEYYRYDNLYIANKKANILRLLDLQEEKCFVNLNEKKTESIYDKPIYCQMLVQLRDFLSAYRKISFGKLVNYEINIGSTSLGNDEYKYFKCLANMCDELHPRDFLFLEKLHLKAKFGPTHYKNPERGTYNELIAENDRIDYLQKKFSKLKNLILECVSTYAHFTEGKIIKFKILPNIVQESLFNHYIIDKIDEGLIILDNIDLHCSIINMYHTSYTTESFFAKYKETLDNTNKIIIHCNCQTPLVMHKHMQTDIDNYKKENPTKEIVVVLGDIHC